MPRDPNRNVYVTIGIPRESATYDALLADAGETGLTVPQLIATRIADWYRLLAGGSVPAGRTPARARQPPHPTEGITSEDRDLSHRAAEAAAAWATFDEE